MCMYNRRSEPEQSVHGKRGLGVIRTCYSRVTIKELYLDKASRKCPLKNRIVERAFFSEKAESVYVCMCV